MNTESQNETTEKKIYPFQKPKKKVEVNNESLSASNFQVPKVYAEILKNNYRYFILSSGRTSGKTSILVVLWWLTINYFSDRDIVILQATSTEIEDSIIKEIKKFLINSGFDVGEDPDCEWYFPKSNDRIVHRGQKGATYFYPITDSKGGQRTRGINTVNKVSLVLYEEAQKNKDANVVEQSVITFIRQLDEKAKIVIVGNNETIGHWFIDYVNSKRNDPQWCYIYSTYKDIWKLLNKQTQDYILNFKKNNYTEYRRLFLGDIHANTSDVVFPQFTREKSYKRIYEIPEQTIVTLFIGVDHATANDTFAAVPVSILEDGTTQTLEVLYDDPEETNRTLAPTEQCEMLEDFVDFLDSKYGIDANMLTTVISVDGAAAPFIAQLKHLKKTAKNRVLWRNIQIKGFTVKKKDVNLGIIKNAFAYGVLTILNEGLYQWDGSPNKHRLVREIEQQRYKNGKLDPTIKNDLCDALEYGLIPYYNNCYNMSFPIRMKNAKLKSHYDDIRRSAKIIK